MMKAYSNDTKTGRYKLASVLIVSIIIILNPTILVKCINTLFIFKCVFFKKEETEKSMAGKFGAVVKGPVCTLAWMSLISTIGLY